MMTPRHERVLDGISYAPGAQFRITTPGTRLVGMKPEGAALSGWSQELQPGDVLTCTGFGPGWGSDPGYGVEFATEQSQADGVIHAAIHPSTGGPFAYRPRPDCIEAMPATSNVEISGGADITNRNRSRWARQAVQAFADATRHSLDGRDLDNPENLDEVLGDLLADLRHLVGEEGYEEANRRGGDYYAEEIAEAGADPAPQDEELSVEADPS